MQRSVPWEKCNFSDYVQYYAFFYCFYITIKTFSTEGDPVCCYVYWMLEAIRVAKCEELFWALPVPEGKGPLILPMDNVARVGALPRLQSAWSSQSFVISTKQQLQAASDIFFFSFCQTLKVPVHKSVRVATRWLKLWRCIFVVWITFLNKTSAEIVERRRMKASLVL